MTTKPVPNFSAVRDGRLAKLRHHDVDLTTARSIAAGTQQDNQISGDAFYIDADPGDGVATIYIQTDGYSPGEVPVYVSPGAIFNTPFTNLRVVNAAQAGKKIRIIYGVGVEFQPGSVAQIQLAGDVALDAATIAALVPGDIKGDTSYSSNAGGAVGSTVVLAPAGNVNGLWVTEAQILGYNSANAQGISLLAKNGATASTSDGIVLLSYASMSGGINTVSLLAKPVWVPAGLGLYFHNSVADSGHGGLMRACKWKLA